MAPIARFDSLRTDRLVMRRWQDGDREPFAALNADPHTMRFFPSTLDRAASDAMIDRLEERFEAQGFGLWALETVHTGQFIGFTGLNPMPDDVPGAGGMEVGWRLARAAWHHGGMPSRMWSITRFRTRSWRCGGRPGPTAETGTWPRSCGGSESAA